MAGSNETKREWTIRDYQEGDEEQILELLGTAESDPKNKQSWKWMYQDGPLGPAVIMLAEEKHRIIGHIAFIPVPIKIKDQVNRALHGVGLRIHPDYRRQGVFVSLITAMKERLKGFYRSIDYGTPSDQSRLSLVNLFNVKEICEIPSLFKVIDWGVILKSHYRIPVFIGKLLGYAWERVFGRASPPKDANIEIEEIFSFDERINQFWEKASKLKNIMIVKDMKYLNWRYISKIGREYKIFIAKKQQEIAGYIVLKLIKGIRSHGIIVDFFTLPGENTVAALLISQAVQYLKEDSAATISCWMLEDTPYYRILRKQGFIRRPGPRLCGGASDPNTSNEFVTNPANWYYVMGDGDGDAL
jgi:GNAT superfamily N-acetyltransferase